jgi:hypothetical protein
MGGAAGLAASAAAAALPALASSSATPGSSSHSRRRSSRSSSPRASIAAAPAVFSDFDPLRCVVIGRADGFQLPVLHADLLIDEYDAAERVGVPERVLSEAYDCDPAWDQAAFRRALGQRFPEHMVEAANVALDDLAGLLEARGAKSALLSGFPIPNSGSSYQDRLGTKLKKRWTSALRFLQALRCCEATRRE